MGEDPIGFDSGDFNLYMYTSNNPINFKDSTGKFTDEAAALVAAAILVRRFIWRQIKKVKCTVELHKDHHPFGFFYTKTKVGTDTCGNPIYKTRRQPCFRKHVHVRCWLLSNGKRTGRADLDVPIPYSGCNRKRFLK